MKKYALSILVILSCFMCKLYARKQEVFSHSFMYTRPVLYNVAMYDAIWHNFVYNKTGNHGSSFQMIGFAQKSREKNAIKQYFLPQNGKTNVLVAGDAISETFFTRDVRAEWLGLPDTFSGVLTINPEQKQAGFIFQYHQNFKSMFAESSLWENTWFSISVPLVSVRNNFGPEQSMVMTGTNEPTQPPFDLIQAFNQPDWQYGKFCPNTLHSFSIAELRIDGGRDYVTQNKLNQFRYYAILSIPFAPKQDASYIFDPFAGNNKHFGTGFGLNMNFLLNKDIEQFKLFYFIDLEAVYLWRNKQKRTFDLRNKPWSRFLPMNRQNGPPDQNIPGVNVLTFDVKVSPFGIFDFATGWRVQTGPFEFELSYSVWGRDYEHIKLWDTIPETFCYGVYGIAGTGSMIEKGQVVATSSSMSTINCQAPNDAEFTPITIEDIDFDSGAASSAIIQKLQVAAGIMHDEYVFFGIGGYFEFAQKNSALQNSGVWVKWGMSF
ncbi:MAG TPA: hypothetical protein PLU71_05110 [Candidatus Dependentiae bacterium]|nr:hypothetical protein [Candidatus Dependentiae bacterium]HRQ63214.1 hypothetical protein [Candidatus Dependentiae bacterium]